jgi:alpha-L-fucosidase
MTVPQLLNLLLKSAADEGNLLLNVGPQASGEIAPAHVSRLREMGRWLRQHEEAIRDSQRCALSPWYNGNTHLGHWTRRGNDAYLHLLRWPGPEFSIPMVQPAPRAATLLTTGKPAPFHYDTATGKISFHDLPSDPPDPHVTVLKLSFDAPPERTVPDDKAAWLQADAEKR